MKRISLHKILLNRVAELTEQERLQRVEAYQYGHQTEIKNSMLAQAAKTGARIEELQYVLSLLEGSK